MLQMKRSFRIAPLALVVMALGLSACWKKDQPQTDETQVAPTTGTTAEGVPADGAVPPADAGATAPADTGAASDAPSAGSDQAK